MSHKSTVLRYAEFYAKHGLRVFPCWPKAKNPIPKNGCYAATTDPAQLRQWWPDDTNNIAIATGYGIIVIDLDNDPDNGKYGDEIWSEWEREHGQAPDTWECLTGGGGRHLYFRCNDERLTVGANIAPGVDFRGAGGYVIAPPSVHQSGNHYEWEVSHQPHETPLADLPEWLHAILLESIRTTTKAAATEIPDKITKGERNAELFRLAASLRARGLSVEAIIAAVMKENELRCDPPLSADEVTTICNSAGRYEKGKPSGEKPINDDVFLDCFKSLDDFEEEEATWLIPGWLPEGQIILMAADGGVGKTSMWCNLIAGISSGTRCILDPLDHTRAPQRVAFLTTEDSVRKKLKKKLRLAGANMSNIITPDFLADKEGALRGLKFGSSEIDRFIKHFRPALCVFDPVQGFVPPDINMGSRNAMRDCMAPLITLGEETGCTFLVVCHTNKRKGAFGRDRIADSADLWDVSRSVLMAGYTEDQGIRYLSNEKNNYAQLQDTLLFTIDSEGQPQPEGTTWKRDREYTIEATVNTSAPKREDCKEWILHELETAGGSMPTKELEEKAKLAGYKHMTIRRAKEELKNNKQIKYFATGSPKEKVWHIQTTGGFVELPPTTPHPWADEIL